MILGAIAAIAAAFSWTYACFIWRSQTNSFQPNQLNLIKTCLAAIIFSPVIASIGWISDIRLVLILFISGILGIAIGDSFYISALKLLGTRRTLTIEAFSPILANFLGSSLIGEHPSLNCLFGACIVTTSLVLIAKQKTSLKEKDDLEMTFNSKGYIYAFLSVIFAVIAGILSRLVLKGSELSPLQSTEIRLIGALTLLGPTVRFEANYFSNQISLENKKKILLATILGTNLGIFLQQTVFKILPIGVGWTLLSTSPIFSLFFAKFEGESVNRMSILYSFISLLGVAIALF